MSRHVVSALAAACLALSAARDASAELFVSPLAADLSQTQVVCYVGNVGSTAISIASARIVGGAGSMPIFYNTCRNSLPAGRICVIAANTTSSTGLFSCRFDLSSKTNARGSMDIRRVTTDATKPDVLVSVEMQ